MTLDLLPVDSPADPRLHEYRDLKENRLKADSGRFVAESESVVRRLLQSGLDVHSVLLTPAHLARLGDVLPAGVPIFVASQAVLDGITGFHVHRGCLAIGQRPDSTFSRLPANARTLLVLEDLVDVDNVGALGRNAAALGADGLVLSPRAADPFYRKAIRVAMGAVFFLPIWRCTRWPEDLARLKDERQLGLVGAVLDGAATPLPTFVWPERVAILLGAEGPGLSPAAQALCDARVTIPMEAGRADSLNVATAGAVFLYTRAASRFTRD